MLPIVGIYAVHLLVVSLALKRYVLVSRLGIAVLDEPYDPFHYVPNVERNEQQLFHLLRMDGLVGIVPVVHHHSFPDEQHTQNIDGLEPLEGDELISNLYHIL